MALSMKPSANVALRKSGGGVFEVTVDGDLIFSKKALRRHAEPGEMVALIKRSR
jgi:selT/selW/selH-like putative selenoprotein